MKPGANGQAIRRRQNRHRLTKRATTAQQRAPRPLQNARQGRLEFVTSRILIPCTPRQKRDLTVVPRMPLDRNLTRA